MPLHFSAAVSEGNNAQRHFVKGNICRCVHNKEYLFIVKPLRGHGQSYLFASIHVNEFLYCVCNRPLQNNQNKTWADTKKQPPAIIQSFGPKLSHAELI